MLLAEVKQAEQVSLTPYPSRKMIASVMPSQNTHRVYVFYLTPTASPRPFRRISICAFHDTHLSQSLTIVYNLADSCNGSATLWPFGTVAAVVAIAALQWM